MLTSLIIFLILEGFTETPLFSARARLVSESLYKRDLTPLKFISFFEKPWNTSAQPAQQSSPQASL